MDPIGPISRKDNAQRFGYRARGNAAAQKPVERAKGNFRNALGQAYETADPERIIQVEKGVYKLAE